MGLHRCDDEGFFVAGVLGQDIAISIDARAFSRDVVNPLGEIVEALTRVHLVDVDECHLETFCTYRSKRVSLCQDTSASQEAPGSSQFLMAPA